MKTQFLYLLAFGLMFGYHASGQHPIHKTTTKATQRDSLPALQRNLDKDPDAARLVKEANAADFIIEGELVSQRYYRDLKQPETYQYQVNTFKILKIFKGNLQCGTIEVLSRGLVGLGGSFMLNIQGSGDIAFGVASKYEMLFLKKDLRDYYNSPADPVQSSNLYRTRTDFVFLYFEQGINEIQIAATHRDLHKIEYFKSYKDFRNYFDDYTGLSPKMCYAFPFDSQLTESSPLIKPKKKEIEADSVPSNMEKQKKIDEIINKGKRDHQQKYTPKGKANINEDLEIKFDNLDYSGTSNQIIEFDVMAKASDNNTYLSNAVVYVQYNDQLFGTDVVANSHLAIYPNTAIDNNSQYSVSVIDKAGEDNVFGVQISNGNGQNMYNMSSNYVVLFHVVLETDYSCNKDINVSFAFLQNISFGSWYGLSSNSGTNVYPYDNVSTNGSPLVFITCKPVIENVSTNYVVSGVQHFVGGKGDVLTITGYNFGSTRGSGTVQFLNANDPSGTVYTSIDDQDYITWSETEITIKLPSVTLSAQDPSLQNPVPCCSLRVKNSATYTSTAKGINVEYGINNDVDGNGNKVVLYPANRNNNGGYSIVVAPSLYANKGALKCIVAAMKKWSCEVGFNWTLTTSSTQTPGIDNICYIYETNLGASTRAATSRHGACGSANYAIKDFDIAMNNNSSLTWEYVLEGGSVSSGADDFYSTILHELGHALGLMHTCALNLAATPVIIDEKEVMYYSQLNNSPRRINITAGKSKDGGGYVTTYAASFPSSCSSQVYGNMIPVSHDLYMQDFYLSSSVFDKGNEPDYEAEVSGTPVRWDIWNSPDLWNQVNTGTPYKHANAEYLGATTNNYIYYRVRNRGCATSPSSGINLKLYWTIASTGEKWVDDWTGVTYIGGYKAGDLITTVSLPAISSVSGSNEYVGYVSWIPPRPQDYLFTQTTMPVCILGRIETSANADYGMMLKEQTGVHIGTNVFNNNNIATRNLVVNNLDGHLKSGGKKPMLVGNTLTSQANFDFVFSGIFDPNQSHNFWSIGYVTVTLGEELYGRWVTNGSEGSHITADPNTFSIRLNANNALIGDIDFSAEEHQFVEIEFHLLDSLNTFDTDSFLFGFSQHRHGEANEPQQGCVMFEVNVEQGSGSGKNALNDPGLVIFPNAVSDVLVVQSAESIAARPLFEVFDILGRRVIEEQYAGKDFRTYQLNTHALAAGTYFIQVSYSGYSKVFKFIKQ